MALNTELNEYHSALSFDDLENSEVEGNVSNFFEYGLSASIASAGVSFWNTGKALGNFFGAEFTATDTKDVLEGIGMTATARYYDANREFVDAVGFAVGAVIPGLAGIKAAQAMKKGVIAYSGNSRAVLGLKQTLYPKDVVARYTDDLMKGKSYPQANTTYVLDAAKQGFRNQAIETLFAEAAILVTMNQNPTISSGELDYFRSIGDNLDSAGLGFVLGAGIGGVAETAFTYKALKSVVKGSLSKAATAAPFTVAPADLAARNALAGDQLTLLAKAKEEANAFLSDIDAGPIKGDEFAARRVKETVARYDQYAGEYLGALLRRKDYQSPLPASANDHLYKSLEKLYKNSDATKVRNLFAGSRSVGMLGDESLLMDVRLSPLHILKKEEADIQAYAYHYYENAGYNMSSPEVMELVQKEIDEMWGTHGATRPSLAWGRPDKDVYTYVFDDPSVPLWRKIQTARHEVGHNQTDKLAKFGKTKFGAEVMEEAKLLSREMRPNDWKAYDRYKQLLDQPTEVLEEMGVGADTMNRMRAHVRYMESPEELFADSWAAFEGGIFKGRPEDSNLYNIFAQNGAAKARYGSNEVALDLHTGETFLAAERVPTVADLGEVKITRSAGKKGLTITYKEGSVQWEPSNDIDWAKADAYTMSAQYAAASSDAFKFAKEATINSLNLPTLLAAIKQVESGVYGGTLTLKTADDSTFVLDFSRKDMSPADRASMLKVLQKEQIKAKAHILDQIRNGKLDPKTGSFGQLEIARMLDMDASMVDTIGLLARDDKAIETLLQSGDRAGISWSEVYDPKVPTAAKVSYTSSRLSESDVKALADVESRKQMQLTYADSTIRSMFTEFFGDKVKVMPSTMLATQGKQNLATTVTPVDYIGGAAGSVQGNYSDFTSFAQQAGAINAKVKELAVLDAQQAAEVAFEAVKRSPEALAEYAYLDSFLRTGHYKSIPATATQFVGELSARADELATKLAGTGKAAKVALMQEFQEFLNSTLAPAMQNAGGVTQLVSTKYLDMLEQATSEGVTRGLMRQLTAGMENEFKPVMNKELVDMFAAAKEARKFAYEAGRRTAALDGNSYPVDPDVWYAGKLDRSRYKKLAFVVPTVDGVFANNKKMILGAPTDDSYRVKMEQVSNQFGDSVRIVTPKQADEYKRLMAEYDADLAFTEWEVNNMAKSRGLLADVAPEPTPQMVDSFYQDILQNNRNAVDALFYRLYDPEVASLQAAHRNEILSGGEMAKSSRKAGDKDKTTSFSKTLDVMFNRNSRELDQWVGMQQKLDRAFSAVANTVGSMFARAKDPLDFQKLNDYAKQYGIPPVYDESIRDYLVRTEKVNDQLLSTWIPKMNSVAATLMLRWDYIQPLVTAISMPITMHPEFRHLLDELPELKKMQLLEADSVINPVTGAPESKNLVPLMYQATKDFWTRKDLVEQYTNADLLGGIAREQMQAVDAISVNPALMRQGASALDAQWKIAAGKLAELAAEPADKAEEFAKFVAARVAHLVLDSAGVTSDSLRERVMRTFVTRTMGNYNAAQRPGIFQGPVGQLFGLFQTYQFNLIQQMLRHMADSPKRAAGMMGIQAGIFGAQSVPGFQILNAHIAEKSDYEDDFYTAANKGIGNTAAEWIVYGAASNFVRPAFGDGIALYTRGDLNPRTPILIPTSLEEVPTISMASRAWSSMSTLASNLGGGAPAGASLVQALSTIGINRPLQGIAQLVQGARTSASGTELVNLEDLNWAQMAMRVAGTKGLNESIASDAYYRAQKYEANRQEKVNTLASAARISARDSNYNSGTYYEFMEKYASAGGDINNYGSWMHRNAINGTQATISRMAIDNRGVEGRYLQSIMGGDSSGYVGALGADDTPYVPTGSSE